MMQNRAARLVIGGCVVLAVVGAAGYRLVGERPAAEPSPPPDASPLPVRSRSRPETARTRPTWEGYPLLLTRSRGPDRAAQVPQPLPGDLRGEARLVPGLARILRGPVGQGPGEHRCMKAAALLAQIGEPARAAIPALLSALARRDDPGGFVFRQDLAFSLVTLCGGPEAAPVILRRHLDHKDPQVRADAARTFGFFSDFLSHRVVRGPGGHYVLPPEDVALRAGFHESIPRLARVLADDPEEMVRRSAGAALLSYLTYNSQDAPWNRALDPLCAVLVRAPNAVERQTAARILAECPAGLIRVLPSLREALGDEDETVRGYVLVALAHIARTSEDALTDAYLADLRSPQKETRRAAAQQIEQAASVLWGYGLWSESLPRQINLYKNNRLYVWRPPDEAHKPEQERQRSQRSQQRRTRFLAGLVRVLEDGDVSVRLSVARALERIGKDVDRLLGHGGLFQTAERDVSQVAAALERASQAVKADNPALAARLAALRERITQPHARA